MRRGGGSSGQIFLLIMRRGALRLLGGTAKDRTLEIGVVQDLGDQEVLVIRGLQQPHLAELSQVDFLLRVLGLEESNL